MRPVASSLSGQIYSNQQPDSHRPRRWIFEGGHPMAYLDTLACSALGPGADSALVTPQSLRRHGLCPAQLGTWLT